MAIDHLAFPAFDVAATHRFYTELLGGTLITAFSGTSAEWGGKEYLMAIYELARGEQIVFFTFRGIRKPKKDNLPRDIRHVAFTAPSARSLRDWKARLARAKVPFWEEDHGDQQSIYFADPNDVLLEMTYPASSSVFQRDDDAAALVTNWTAHRPPRTAVRRTARSAKKKTKTKRASRRRVAQGTRR